MASEGLTANTVLNDKIEQQSRWAHKVALVRQHVDALQTELDHAQEKVSIAQTAEANALHQLQNASLSQLSEQPDVLTHLKDLSQLPILDEIAQTTEPLQPQLTAYKTALCTTATAKHHLETIQIEFLIAGNKLDVLLKNEADSEIAKYHRDLLKWLIFVNQSFADRADMDVFPVPPPLPHGCDGSCQKRADRKLHVCDCSVKAAFVFADGLGIGYDLGSERRRWHPEQFGECDGAEREGFREMAGEVWRVVDGLWQRRRMGLGL